MRLLAVAAGALVARRACDEQPPRAKPGRRPPGLVGLAPVDQDAEPAVGPAPERGLGPEAALVLAHALSKDAAETAPLGAGGFGQVERWSWADVACAVKQSNHVGRLREEFRLLKVAAEAGVRVPTPLCFWETGFEAYLAEAEVAGAPLHKAFQQDPRLELNAVVRALFEEVNKLHAAGIVHNDLKPENIMVASARGREVQVTLLDFGSATQGGGGADRTYDYGPPEADLGTAAGDWFSAALVAATLADPQQRPLLGTDATGRRLDAFEHQQRRAQLEEILRDPPYRARMRLGDLLRERRIFGASGDVVRDAFTVYVRVKAEA